MEKNYKDIEMIERYLNKISDDTEVAEVKKRLVDDEEFRDLFDDMELLAEALKRSGSDTSVEDKIRALEASIQELDEEEPVAKEIRMIQPWYRQPGIRAIAASVAIIFVAVYLVQPFGSPSPGELYAEHFSKFDNIGAAATRSSDEGSYQQKAYAFYDSDKHREAVDAFEKSLEDSDNVGDRFYLANSLMVLERFEEAEVQLQIVEAKGVGLVSDARWYLGLLHLKGEDVEEAKRYFSMLKDSEDHGEDARRILKQLE